MRRRKIVRRRRSPLRGDAERARILEIAKQVFAQRGYADASLREICELAHVGRGTLYRHFGSKRAMLEAMIDQIASRIQATLRTQPEILPPAPGVSIRDALVAFSIERMETMLRAVFADEATLRLFAFGAPGVDDAVDRLIARIDELALDSIEADLRTGQLLGVLRQFDTRQLARFCLGGLQKLLRMELQDGRSPDLKAITRMVVELELWGLSSEAFR